MSFNDLAWLWLQLHAPEEQKIKSLNGLCLYAYEFKPLPAPAQKISRQFQIESLPDIQRSTTTISSEYPQGPLGRFSAESQIKLAFKKFLFLSNQIAIDWFLREKINLPHARRTYWGIYGWQKRNMTWSFLFEVLRLLRLLGQWGFGWQHWSSLKVFTPLWFATFWFACTV